MSSSARTCPSKEGVTLFKRVVFGDLKDGIGIEDSGEGFVDLVLDLGRSVYSLLVVVLCLVDGVQLKKET